MSHTHQSHLVAVALAVLNSAFGAVDKTSVKHDLHLPFAHCILILKLVAKFSNNNSVEKNFQIHALFTDLFFNESWLRNLSDSVIRDARGAGFQR